MSTITSIEYEDVHFPCNGNLCHIYISDGDSQHEVLALDYLRLGITTIQYENGETFIPTEECSLNRTNGRIEPYRLALGLEESYNPFDILNSIYFFNLEDSPYTLTVSQTKEIPDMYKNAMKIRHRVNREMDHSGLTFETMSDDFSSIFLERIEEYAANSSDDSEDVQTLDEDSDDSDSSEDSEDSDDGQEEVDMQLLLDLEELDPEGREEYAEHSDERDGDDLDLW